VEGASPSLQTKSEMSILSQIFMLGKFLEGGMVWEFGSCTCSLLEPGTHSQNVPTLGPYLTSISQVVPFGAGVVGVHILLTT
jgi:hypothetical protein